MVQFQVCLSNALYNKRPCVVRDRTCEKEANTKPRAGKYKLNEKEKSDFFLGTGKTRKDDEMSRGKFWRDDAGGGGEGEAQKRKISPRSSCNGQ